MIAPWLAAALKQARQRAPALALALLCSTSAGLASAARAANDESPTEARVIVKFRSAAVDSSPGARIAAAPASSTGVMQRAQTMGRRHGLTLADGNTIAPRTQVLKARGMSSTALAARLAADPDVEYVEIDRRMRAHAVPNDPLYAANPANSPAAGQWYLRAPVGELVSSINVEGAWDISTGSTSIVVAVLDTGVFKEHLDLAGKLLPGYDFIANVNQANDGNGWDDDPSDPGDWITTSENDQEGGQFYGCVSLVPDEPHFSDSNWHGTQMAGLIGATTNNNLGMAGIGRDVKVLPVRVLGKCGGFVSEITTGMRWAAGLNVVGAPKNPNPAQVINLSLGGEGSCSRSTFYRDTISTLIQMGVVVVASGGNKDGLAVDMPADCDGVIAVGGVRHSGSKNGFSSLGPEISVSAPGGNCVNLNGQECLHPILSTSNTGTTVPVSPSYTDGFLNAGYGTSHSAALVSGTVALMLSVEPSLTPAQIRQLLQRSARPFPAAINNFCHAPDGTKQLECNCTTSTCGAGMLDARAAVLAATQPVPALDSGGSGGGALGLGWLTALAGAVATLAWQRRRGSAAG